MFGAKQFHPVLQSSLIESYYVKFYTVINVGALAGICIIPIVAQRSIVAAYSLPLCSLTAAGISFLLGTPRYIMKKPDSNKQRTALLCGGRKPSIGNYYPKSTTLFEIFRISVLVVPFSVGYNQMPTTFIVQGSVMSKAFGVIDVATMNSLDTISVLFFGSITANYIFPYFAKRGIKIPTTYKFAIGSLLGACAVAWAIVVEKMIHNHYKRTGSSINVLWQSPAYILIGFGEIFAVSTAYEVAFTASPPNKKVLSSATNIFCVGGLPNMICIGLFRSCSKWFTNSHGNQNIGQIEDYATASVGKYFVVLLVIMLFGAIINVMPGVKNYVESIEERASDSVKTPTITPSMRRHQPKKQNRDIDEENSRLLVLTPQTKKYQQYLKYGSGPIYTRHSSIRAGPSLSRGDLPGSRFKKIKYKAISKIYGNAKEHAKTREVNLAAESHGEPNRSESREAK